MKMVPKRLFSQMKNPVIFYKWDGMEENKNKYRTQLKEKKENLKYIFKRSTASGNKK